MPYAILPRRAIRNENATFCSYAFFAYAAMFFCIVQYLLFFCCFCLRQRGFLHTWFLACSYFCLRWQCFYNIDAFMMSSFYIKNHVFYKVTGLLDWRSRIWKHTTSLKSRDFCQVSSAGIDAPEIEKRTTLCKIVWFENAWSSAFPSGLDWRSWHWKHTILASAAAVVAVAVVVVVVVAVWK